MDADGGCGLTFCEGARGDLEARRSRFNQSISVDSATRRSSIRPWPLSMSVPRSGASPQIVEEALNLGKQAGLAGVHRDEIVGAGVHDRLGNPEIAGDDIDGARRAVERFGGPAVPEAVGSLGYRLLADNQAFACGERRYQARRGLERGAARLRREILALEASSFLQAGDGGTRENRIRNLDRFIRSS